MLQVANTHIKEDEPLFFKAYLTTEKLPKRYSKSKVLNLELLDDKGVLIKRQFHKIVDGMVEGQLELPKNSVSGNYAVKAYTRWSQNYGPDFIAQQKIQLGVLADEEEEVMDIASGISIIPEGGALLSNHDNRIFIRIPDQTKNRVARILDENRQEVAQVSFYSSELGTAIFRPQKGKLYELELEDGTLCPIPRAEADGFLLQVNNLDGDIAKIRITASTAASDSKVTLIGSAGGINYFERKLDFRDGKVLDVELSKISFPHGVFTLKLVDDLGAELANRPIWVAGERLQIHIEPLGLDTDKALKTYKVKVTDHNNSPIKSQLAISVNKYDSYAELDINQSIRRTFSEIFEEDKITDYRKESFLKDLDIMSSTGKMKDQTLNNNIKFSLQKGLEIMGHAYDLNNTLLSHTKIQMMATSEKDVWIGEAETDAQGLLKLEDIQIEGKAVLVARTEGDDVKSRLVKIVPIEAMEQKRKILMPYVLENPIELAGKQPVVHKETSNMEKSEKTIELDEVEVVEKGVERKKYTPSLYGIDVPPGRVAYQNFERPRSILQMLAELPGVVVGGAETLNPYAYILGSNGPILWVLDGFPLSQAGGGTQMGTPSLSSLSQIMAMANDRDIERIELVKGPEASIFGSRASGGVFIIYTRTGNELEYIRRKDGQLVFEGYTTALDFEEYKEGLSKRKESKINLLYWNPNLETNENGEAIISIPAEDAAIKIEASTISLDGKMGSVRMVD